MAAGVGKYVGAFIVGAAVLAVACTPVAVPPGPTEGRGYGTTTGDSSLAAYTILPPGNGGMDGPTAGDVDDQREMYDLLDDPVADGTLTDDALGRYFKSEPLGQAPEPGDRVEDFSAVGRQVTVRWDEYSVPHVQGETSDDVAYGAGFAVAEARFVILELARLLGRTGLLETSGGSDNLVTILDRIGELPHVAYSEEELEAQVDRAIAAAPSPEEGAQILSAVDSYVAGINSWMDQAIEWPALLAEWGVTEPKPWTRTDVVAAGITINDIFGYAGGDEVGNAAALDALVTALGPDEGPAVYADLRSPDDPDATTTVTERFPYPLFAGAPTPTDPASIARPDTGAAAMADGYVAPVPPHASNYVAVGGSRTESGHPVLVGGPQSAYFAPQLLMEMELQGGGYASSGITFPGLGPWILIGHGAGQAWSVTSGDSDQVDQRIELLCEPDGAEPSSSSLHYVFNGECRAMTKPDPSDPQAMWRTVHGPVIGTTTVQGQPVAISRERSSRGQEAMAALSFWRLSRGEVDTAEEFAPAMQYVPMSFNWTYVDATDIAYFHSGVYPIRAAGASYDLPTWGTGEWEWQGTLDWTQQPHGIDPVQDYLVSWNNKPAPGWSNADNKWGVSAVQRVDLLDDRVRDLTDASVADVVTVAQDAATSDLRGSLVLSTVLDMLAGSPAPTAELEDLRTRLTRYVDHGAHRRDRNHDGLYDDPMTPVVDNLWEPLVHATFGDALGPYLAQESVRRPHLLDNAPAASGSSFNAPAWYSLVEREIRRVQGLATVPDGVPLMCGDGDLAACRAAMWDALNSTRWTTQQQQLWQGDITKWTKLTLSEQIRFIPYVVDANSMRWVNRPTYQQVMSFGDAG